jgi:methanogenic corrinoid protein MtbC1
MTRTAGGHRRISLPEALRFVRASGQNVVRPEILGLKGLRRRLATPLDEQGAEELFEALRDGRAANARGLITGWYLAGRPLADIFDGPIRSAMQRLGELWQHSREGILQEHAASVVCAEAVVQLRDLLPAPSSTAPAAVGGAPEGDYYQLPTLLAATTLRGAGYRDWNYGPNTPLPLLASAARERGALIIWISISSEVSAPLRRQIAALAEELSGQRTYLAVGGRLSSGVVPPAPNVRLMSSMGELAAFAAALGRGEA